MNLTSKRLLQFFAGCVGVCAFSASAADPYFYVKDTFDESSVIYYTASGPEVPASSGMAINHYKATLNGSADIVAPTNWAAAAGDASMLSNVVVSFDTATGKRPLDGGTRVNVLNLETEGQTLTRTLDNGATPNFSVNDVYVDTMIKFTPSEDTPTIDPTVKAAVFVNVSSNLVVYHGGNGGESTDVSYAIDPTQWYRLTILMSKLGEMGNGGATMFKVYVNNNQISSSEGVDQDFNPNGPWFFVAGGGLTLSSVAFQGTGMIDELVVADQANGITTPTSVLLTLTFDSTVTVLDGTTPVSTGGTVAVGDTIHISTADWYELISVVGTDVTYSDSARLGAGQRVMTSSGTLAAGAATAVTITAAQFTGPQTTGLGAPYDVVDGAKLSAWAVANHKTIQNMLDDGSKWLDEYLLNIAPNDAATKLAITDIVIDPVAETATITVTGAGVAVDFTKLNGTLVVYTATTLAGGFHETAIGNYTPHPANGSATVVVKYAAGSFIKAVVK